ncbi:type IV pilus assembly protein PilW [Candidatus Magnetomoraceae bacterium gMMP-15]
MKSLFNHKGFTFIELLIAMAVSGIVMASVYSAYESQQKIYTTQQELTRMQQNIRTAVYMMERDLRMAGFDPTGNAGAGIMTANVAELQFQIDENENGNSSPSSSTDPSEQIRYALTDDDNEDGISDSTSCNLGRAIWTGGLQTVAENIDALNFVYFDSNHNILTTPVANLGDIRSIQVSIVARSSSNSSVFLIKNIDNNVYTNPQGTVILDAQNDNARRIILSFEVKCRNLGL